MPSPWRDLDRPPLREAPLREALITPDSLWNELQVVQETTSTNADVAEATRAGAPEGLVVVAEVQTAGRGRAGRHWNAPLRSGLAVSVLLRPPVATRASWGWLPLLAGVAVVESVSRLSGLPLGLKWPNDVLIDDRKLAGLLAEVVEDAVVLGMGLNVTLRPEERPVPAATSLQIEGSATIDREPVLRAVLRDLALRYRSFLDYGGDADAAGLHAAYRSASASLGQQVRVSLPGGRVVLGEVLDVDKAGRLLVRTGDGVEAFAAGDVVHLRQAGT